MKEYKIIESQGFMPAGNLCKIVYPELEERLNNYSKEGYVVSQMAIRPKSILLDYDYIIILLEKEI